MSKSAVSGFPEFSLATNIIMLQVRTKIELVYMNYGFGPFDTRLVEPAEIMISKGIDGKEVYTLSRLNEESAKNMKNNLALRFDLTVPLARFIAENKGKLKFPFKRHQIAKVYRGEKSNKSSGRFREFYQSDIDVVGCGSLSLEYDAEFPAIIHEIFLNIIGVKNFVIRINNRKLLQGLFVHFGIVEVAKIKKCVAIIDDIEKVDVDTTIERLVAQGLKELDARRLIHLFDLCQTTSPEKVVEALKNVKTDVEMFKEGLTELITVVGGVLKNGVDRKRLRVDLIIARGLDYYTGTVYETNLLDFPELGSVCSGGRYADLVSTLTGNPKDVYPGCGISIGLSRLVPTLIERGVIKSESPMVSKVMMICQDEKEIGTLQELATKVRKLTNVDICYKPKRLKNGLKYINALKIPFAVFNIKGETFVKDMRNGEQWPFNIKKMQELLDSLKNDKSVYTGVKHELKTYYGVDTDVKSKMERIMTSSKGELKLEYIKEEMSSLDKIKINNQTVVMWYVGGRAKPEKTEAYYSDFMKSANEYVLLDISAWNAFFYPKNKLGKRYNSDKHKLVHKDKIIHTAAFFDFLMKDVMVNGEFYTKVFSEKSIFATSAKFKPSGIKVSSLFPEDVGKKLSEFMDIDKDAAHVYSAFQFLELIWIIRNILCKRLHSKQTINFVLPNDECKYYPDEMMKYVGMYLKKTIYCDVDVTIRFVPFKFGEKPSDRPYNNL